MIYLMAGLKPVGMVFSVYFMLAFDILFCVKHMLHCKDKEGYVKT